MKKVMTFIIALFGTISIFSQAPQAFNYQGVARDLSGNVLPNQNMGLRIAILQGSIDGVEVFKETHAVTTNSLGLFKVQIGNGTAVNGSLSDVTWGHGSHFLQIEMDEDGGNNFQLIGTTQLLSIPYALYAESGGEWKNFTNGIYYKRGEVRIGQDNGVQFNSVPTLNIFGDAEPDNFILRLEQGGDGPRKGIFFGSPGSFTSGRLFLDNDVFSLGRGNNTPNFTMLNFGTNGNIGINEKVPKSKLHLKEGDIYIEEIDRGVIMKSPDGQCWRLTVNNAGQLVPIAITCPN